MDGDITQAINTKSSLASTINRPLIFVKKTGQCGYQNLLI